MNAERPTVFAGAAIAALGAAIALAEFWWPALLRAPTGVALAAALVFVVGGWAVIARSHAHMLLKVWLPVALLAAITAIPLWLALGPGLRRCIVDASPLAVTLLGRSSEWLCRGLYAAVAAVGVALLLLAAAHAIRVTRSRKPN